MNRSKRHSDSVIAILLILALMISVCICTYPGVSAAESDEAAIAYDVQDKLTDTGYTHRTVSFDGVPEMIDADLQQGIAKIFLSSEKLYIDTNESSLLSVTDAYSHSVNARVKFTSSNSAIAAVSDAGLVTGKSKGSAKITASDSVTGLSKSCTVYVGENVLPTQAAVTPTDEPYEAPVPTQTPAPKPTSPPPTQAPPTQAPTQPPATAAPAPTSPPATQAAVTETLKLKASSATVYKGCYYHVVATSNVSVSFTSSNTSVATVNSKGIVTAVAAGTSTITAKTSTKSAICNITVKAGSSVNLSKKSASVNRFMTYLMTSSTSGVTWSSSDTSVATVKKDGSYGYVYGVKAGVAVITVSTSSGAATCLMTVEPSHSVRYAYASPNCAAKNQTVTLVGVTDTMRTGVRFAVTVGSTTRYVNATSKTKEGDTYVWKGTTSFSTAGTYKVKTYSQYNGGTSWTTYSDGDTTAFVANSTDMTTTVCAKRRASDSLIKLIATFEGYYASAYLDTFTGDPTLGYGVLVFPGEQFYNNLTKTEAYALLSQSVNNDGYSESVNTFLINNNIKFNQRQYDALVCFVYNCGVGPLSTDAELKAALLNCSKNGVKDFTYIGKQTFIDKLCAYHHAGGGCVYGLLYRRVDETEMFFYGDYNADYGNYRYAIKYECYRNKSFHT